MSFKSIIGTVAPMLATALGSPLAGVAVKTLATALGCEPDEKSVEQAILNASPSDLVKVKEVEATFKVDMKKLDIDLARIDAEDRDSARKREMSVGGRMNGTLAVCILCGFFGTMGAMFLGVIPDGNKDVLFILIGALAQQAGQVVGYYFGSSKSSKDKTSLLATK